MGVMDKFLNYMKLNDEEDEGFYDDDYLDDEEEVEPVKKFSPAKSRQQAGADADKRRRQPDVHAADHGKGNADGQRVYGSCHSHEKHGPDGQVGVLFRVVAGFVFLLQRFLQHVDADDDQQTEGNPVVERFNGFGKQRAKKKAGHGHQHLETAEPESAGRLRLQRCLFHGKTLAYGYREGVHTQPHRQQEQFSDSHKKILRTEYKSAQKTRRDCAGLQKSRHFRLNRGLTSMSIQSRVVRRLLPLHGAL